MLLNQKKNRVVAFGLLLLTLASCSEMKDQNYIARVGESILTESMIDDAIGKNEESKIFREELIRKWIEKNLIYLSAVDKGIVESEKYSELLENAKLEIANAIVIRLLIDKNTQSVTNKKLEKYYVENISEFKLAANRIKYSQVSFSSKSIAIEFRRKLVSNDWKNLTEEFSNRDALLFSSQNNFEYIFNILPMRVRIELSKLEENGVSGVIETSQGIFTILQLTKSYKKNDVPEFNEIEIDIKEKYIAKNRKEVYNNYIKQLYSEYGSEIER